MNVIRRYRTRQDGVVLFVALIVLVVMALAGVAMVRQSGTGLSVAGNIAMRQSATSAGDLGTETARVWWKTKSGVGALDNDLPAEGYYSDWGPAGDPRRAGDPSQYSWAGAVLVTPDDGGGNAVSYIVERLCMNPNQAFEVAAQLCVNSPNDSGGNNSGTTCADYPNAKVLCEKRANVHFRISTKVVGPKSTVSYIQVMVK